MVLCSPAFFYFVMSAISIIVLAVNHVPLVYLLLKVVFSGAWTWALNFLCNKGYKTVSWFLVISPFIVMTILIFTGSIEGLSSKTERSKN